MGNTNHDNNSVQLLKLVVITLAFTFLSSQVLAGNRHFNYESDILPTVLAQGEPAPDSGSQPAAPPSSEPAGASSSPSDQSTASSDAGQTNSPPESSGATNPIQQLIEAITSPSSGEGQPNPQPTTNPEESSTVASEQIFIEPTTTEAGSDANVEQPVKITKGDIADIQNPTVTLVTSDELELKIEQAAKKEEVVVTPEEIASIMNPSTGEVVDSKENSELALEEKTETVIAASSELQIIESSDLTDVTTATEQYQTEQLANQGLIVVKEDEAKAIEDSIASTNSNNIDTAEVKIDGAYGEGWQSTKPYSYDFFADETDTSQESVQ